MKTLTARTLAGVLVAGVAGALVMHGSDDTRRIGAEPDTSLLSPESLDPDSAFFRGDFETAAALYRVMALAGRARPPGSHAEIGVVRSLIALGRFDEAERYIHGLDDDSTHTLPPPDTDLLVCLRSEIYTRRAEIPLAVEYASDCRRRIGPDSGYDALVRWYALYVTAFAHAEADEFDAAIGYYLDALVLLDSSGRERTPEYARTINHVANIHYRTGSFTLSRRLHEEALDLRLTLFSDRHPAVAASFGNVGNVLHAMGDFESALTHHRRALSIWTRSLGSAHPQTAYSLNNIGFALNGLRRFDEAEYYLLRAAELKSRVLSGGSLSLARTHRNLADAYLGQGNTHLARRYAERALAAVNESGHHMDILAAQALVTLSGILRAEGRMAEADTALLNAQNRALEQNHPYAVVVMNELARSSLETGRSEKALAVTHRAIAFGSAARGRRAAGRAGRKPPAGITRSSHHVVAESHRIQARARLDLYRNGAGPDQLEAALLSVRRAVDILDDSPLIRTDLTMSGYLRRKVEELASTGLDIAIEEWACGCGGDPIRDALTYSDMLKNGFEYTERLIAARGSEAPGDRAAVLDSLELSLFEARRRRAVLDLEFAATPRRTEELDRQIFDVERQIRAARGSIRFENATGLIDMFDPGPVDIETLPNDLMIADFARLEDRIVSISISRDGAAIHEIPRTVRLDALFETYPEIVRGAGPALFARHARALYEHLLEPLGIDAGFRRLLISPHDVLWDVPFETLLTRDPVEEGRGPSRFGDLPYLILERAVSYTRSAAAFVRESARLSPTEFPADSGKILAAAPGFDYEHALSDPVRDFLSLHGFSHLEADRHATISGSLREVLHLLRPDMRTPLYEHMDVLLDADATETAITELLGSPYNIVHIATHGYASTRSPEYAGILLSPDDDTNDDGVLYAKEIRYIRIQSRLMVISACYSGYSNGGEYPESRFIYALSSSDIHNVLLALWPIMDASSSDIAEHFYTYIYDRHNVESALRHAKIRAIRGTPATAPPAVWAPFVHVSNSHYGVPVL